MMKVKLAEAYFQRTSNPWLKRCEIGCLCFSSSSWLASQHLSFGFQSSPEAEP